MMKQLSVPLDIIDRCQNYWWVAQRSAGII